MWECWSAGQFLHMPAKILCLWPQVPGLGVLILMASNMRSSMCTCPYLKHGILPGCTTSFMSITSKLATVWIHKDFLYPTKMSLTHLYRSDLTVLFYWHCLLLPRIPKSNMDSSGLRVEGSASFVSHTAPSTELSASVEWVNEWIILSCPWKPSFLLPTTPTPT